MPAASGNPSTAGGGPAVLALAAAVLALAAAVLALGGASPTGSGAREHAAASATIATAGKPRRITMGSCPGDARFGTACRADGVAVAITTTTPPRAGRDGVRALSHPASYDRVIDAEHDHGADDADDHAPDVEPRDAGGTERVEHEASDQRADD